LRDVLAEECHWTVLAYLQLLEMDRLTDVQAMDRMYHGAKLTAAAFGEPERIWKEHEEVRAAMLRPIADPTTEPPTIDRSEHLKLALSIQDRLTAAGILPRSGEMH
jgi:hypothetical protein